METLTRAYLLVAGERFSKARLLFEAHGFQLHRVRVLGNPMARYFCLKNATRADFKTISDAEAWLAVHNARQATTLAGCE